jgi:hypothetical protein
MASWTQIGNDIEGETGGDQFGRRVAMNGDGTVVATAAALNDDGAGNAGEGYVYSWNGSAWSAKGTSIQGGESGANLWSTSLSDDGDRVAFGERNYGSNTGRVRIYEYSGGSWGIMGSGFSGPTSSKFGVAISLNNDGDRIIVGANGTGSGFASVYDWNGSAWVQLGSNTDIQGDATGDQLGVSVDINNTGDVVIASGNGGNGGDGLVKVYTWSGSAWSARGSTITNGTGDQYGQDVSINGDGTVIAIAANNNGTNSSGYVKVYVWGGSSWTQRGSTINTSASEETRSVSLNNAGDVLAVGTKTKVDIYQWSGSSWTSVGSQIDGEKSTDWFGDHCELSTYGDYVVVGASFADSGITNNGEMYVYYNSDLTPATPTGSLVVSGSGTAIASGSGTFIIY